MSKIPEHLLFIRPFFLSTPGILISLLRRTSENLGVHWLPKFQETVLQACTIGCWWEDTVSVVCLAYLLYHRSKTASQTLKNELISLVIRASDYHSLRSSFPIPVWFSKGLSAHWLIHFPLKCLLHCGHSAWIWPMRQVSDPHTPYTAGLPRSSRFVALPAVFRVWYWFLTSTSECHIVCEVLAKNHPIYVHSMYSWPSAWLPAFVSWDVVCGKHLWGCS